MGDVAFGVVLSLIAGIINGSFAAPTKYSKLWKWENIWAVWAIVALFMVPWTIGFLTIPDLLGVYGGAEVRPLLLLVGFGMGNGLAQICFGLGLAAIGLSLGFAIAIGISTALGSLAPLVILHPELIPTAKGMTIIGGVFLILVGIIVCAVAGRMKEAALAPPGNSQHSSSGAGSWRKFLYSIFAGILSPTANFALAFGGPLVARAADRGAQEMFKAGVLWPPFLFATMVPYLAYCAHLWRKNDSFKLYSTPGTGHYWLFGLMMGLLWTGSLYMFGASATYMSALGPILGWPLFMSIIIITSNVWGFATGEWKGAGSKPVSFMLGGIVFLILGFVTLAIASR
jgi:L-rhamnose-H+ transport protein